MRNAKYITVIGHFGTIPNTGVEQPDEHSILISFENVRLKLENTFGDDMPVSWAVHDQNSADGAIPLAEGTIESEAHTYVLRQTSKPHPLFSGTHREIVVALSAIAAHYVR